jgi:hypothetical protein
MKSSAKKFFPIALIIILALVLVASSSGIAHAGSGLGTPTGGVAGASGSSGNGGSTTPSPYSCGITSLVTCGVNFITYFISKVFDLFILIGGWLVEQGLQLTNKVYSSTAVQSGFGAMLALANLGFVLAIIVIAIATILQSETYGYKKALWRLVVMAILVNFGLVITAPIVGFANGMTTYFENSIQTGGNSITTQIGNQLQIGIASTPPTINSVSPSASFMQTLMQLVFIIVFKFIIALALLLIGILLFVRFFWLAMLLILLPAAWLTWIFPNFKGQFDKWWEKFIHWTFFAPAAMFFIWLSMYVQQSFVQTTAQQNGNTASAALATAIGLPTVVNQLINNLVAVGILIGGLMAASKLAGGAGQFAVKQGKAISNAVAGAVTSPVTGAAKGIGGYAGKQTKKTARWAYQRAGGDRLNAALMRSRIPLASTIGVKAADTTKKGGADLIKKASTDLKLSGQSDDDLVNLAQGTRGNDKRFAVLEEMQKRGKLNKIDKIDGKTLTAWLADNEQTFKDYGQGKLKRDIDNSLLSDNESRRVAQKIAAAGEAQVSDTYGVVGPAGTQIAATDLAGGARVVARNAQEAIDTIGPNAIIDHYGRQVKAADLLQQANETAKKNEDLIDSTPIDDRNGLLGPAGANVRAGDLLRAASEKFMSEKDKGDIGKMKPGVLFDEKAKFGLDDETIKVLGQAFTHGVATQTPTLVSSIARKLDSWKHLQNFANDYKGSIEQARDTGRITIEHYDELSKAIKKVLGNKLTAESHEEHEAAPAATPAASGTPPPAGGH